MTFFISLGLTFLLERFHFLYLAFESDYLQFFTRIKIESLNLSLHDHWLLSYDLQNF